MADSQLVQMGSRVTIKFSLSLASGLVAEDTDAEESETFVIGQGELLPALEDVLMGATAGQTVVRELSMQEAFGARDEDNVQQMPRASFPVEMALQPDLVIGFDTPAGDETPGVVTAVDDETVTVDFNHPLAGHDVIFVAEILAVE